MGAMAVAGMAWKALLPRLVLRLETRAVLPSVEQRRPRLPPMMASMEKELFHALRSSAMTGRRVLLFADSQAALCASEVTSIYSEVTRVGVASSSEGIACPSASQEDSEHRLTDFCRTAISLDQLLVRNQFRCHTDGQSSQSF